MGDGQNEGSKGWGLNTSQKSDIIYTDFPIQMWYLDKKDGQVLAFTKWQRDYQIDIQALAPRGPGSRWF